jgi:hypothetical protein
MTWRQLPDGSYLDSNTGDLRGFDPAREGAARALSGQAGRPSPKAPNFPVLPQQRMVVLPSARGPSAIIDPKPNLALNPYELGMGAMSDTTKRMLLIAGLVGVAWMACYASRPKHKKA